MKRGLFAKSFAVLLMFSLVTPPTLLVAPQQAHAQLATFDAANFGVNTKTSVESVITAIKSTLTEVNTYTSAVANQAMLFNVNVLQPLAFVLSGNLMKMITAGVIAFVVGKANGTGVPQFVVDVQNSLQTVSDSQALAFFDQFARNSNSPFSGAINSYLRTNYLQKTSLAGFWSAYRSNLNAVSPNINSFLAGNWNQGGIAAWFALTTQTQNNPYLLAQAAQSQLSNMTGRGVDGATGARLAELGWGQGFSSWCGSNESKQSQNLAVETYQACIETGASEEVCRSQLPGVGLNPGDACINKDGTAGTIKTPGSVIVATLNKVLGGQQDQIVRMGNVGPEITSILGNVATVLQTVNFATQILGGPGSGGLFGVDEPTGTNSTSRLAQFQNTPGYLGVTNSTVYQNAVASSQGLGVDAGARSVAYEKAWKIIEDAAKSASANVSALEATCTEASAGIQGDATFRSKSALLATQAKDALKNEIEPVLAKAAEALVVVANARAFGKKIQDQLKAGGENAVGSTFAADSQTYRTMAPTTSDVAYAERQAMSFNTGGGAVGGSLTATGESLVDQMKSISASAQALELTCVWSPQMGTTSQDSGGF